VLSRPCLQGSTGAMCAQSGARAPAAQAGLDGCRNVWILKPGGLSRGRGISLVTSLAQVRAPAALEARAAQDAIALRCPIQAGGGADSLPI
jgi:hypothetical protein